MVVVVVLSCSFPLPSLAWHQQYHITPSLSPPLSDVVPALLRVCKVCARCQLPETPRRRRGEATGRAYPQLPNVTPWRPCQAWLMLRALPGSMALSQCPGSQLCGAACEEGKKALLFRVILRER